ncbi:epoxide hydrolase [Colletotrichum truncatum]|uniref:Epoxide hydrolase n=1 Tax=Colletotrichum truncatum TaxID=5467 RepID=A0ACC3YKZ1_COLTU|nr:epoxide hydrolase [Colletotrichum truncatum]KAF6782852.1 epoxide hydrolase [Colletotrichum truncatum]
MSAPFASLPANASSTIQPFTISIPESDLKAMLDLISLSKIGSSTWENSQSSFGTTHRWLTDAKTAWLNPSTFSWRKDEERINSFPNFTLNIPLSELSSKWKYSGTTYDVHFVALFSQHKDATPVVLLHGFPGSFLEYLPILDLLRDRFTPETLPYHIVVPSLPGYGFSKFSPEHGEEDSHTEFTLNDGAKIINELMVLLGFGHGYIAHGGDVGTLLARLLAQDFHGCKAFHLNGLFATKESVPPHMDDYTEEDRRRLAEAQGFFATGFGYSLMHQTKPGTIGLAIASNPLSLLAWIGEKLRDWTDVPLPLSTILTNVTLYWLTDTYPRCIYSNRFPPSVPLPQTKPFGVSNFPLELVPAPKAWVEKTFPSLVFYKDYERGGHFPAWEEPKAMLGGLEEFIAKVKPALCNEPVENES